MYTMRRTRTLMPRAKPNGQTKNFQFRMTPEETERWQALFDKAWKRTHGCIDETKFNRLLLGLRDDPAVLTPQERAYFQQAGMDKAELIGRAPASKPHIREVSPRSKRK
jgi:hypothetical protein